MEDSAEGAGSGDINARLANRRRGKGTGNPGKPGKKLRLADLQSQFGVGLKVCSCRRPDLSDINKIGQKKGSSCRPAQ